MNWNKCKAIKDDDYAKKRGDLAAKAIKLTNVIMPPQPKAKAKVAEWRREWDRTFLAEVQRLAKEAGLVIE